MVQLIIFGRNVWKFNRRIAAIYNAAGLEFTAKTKNELKQAMTNNKKDKYGKHRYRLEDFGLTSASVQQAFSVYVNDYNIPAE